MNANLMESIAQQPGLDMDERVLYGLLIFGLVFYMLSPVVSAIRKRRS
jgi:tetrahydromethanopterin S-methyltransferase subunit G